MQTISLLNGLILTIVSMVVVFIILAAIWGLIELVSYFIGHSEPSNKIADQSIPPSVDSIDNLAANEKNQQVAELMALVLASEDETDKKFEIIEVQRIK